MELSLDLSLVSAPRPVSQLLSDVSRIDNVSSRLSEIDGYVDRLEDEKRKIDAFKRELPLCVLLLSDAIRNLREEARRYRGANRAFGEDGGVIDAQKSSSDQRNWMRPGQLWSSGAQQIQLNGEEDYGSAAENPSRKCDFRGDMGIEPLPGKGQPSRDVHPPFLSLVPPVISETSCSAGSGSVLHSEHNQTKRFQSKLQQQQQRKQRRRWSPELHRRFVEALHRLGGCQAATPKQIREVMRVQDLSNDEVKSHLQKYRLHLRKHAVNDQAAAERATTMWMDPPENESNHCLPPSSSPQCHLVAARGLFSNGDESVEAEEDEKSDCHSRKARADNGEH